MQISKNEKYRLKLLKRLRGKGALVEPLGLGDAVLLRFDGDRRVMCDAAVVQHWLSAGRVKMNGSRLVLSDDGISAVRRQEAKAQVLGHQAQHGMTVSHRVDGKSATPVLVDLNESPLARLASLKSRCGDKWLLPLELQAGERLRQDFEYAQLRQRVTMSYDPSHTASGGKTAHNKQEQISTSALDARKRVNAALDAIGPEMASVALDVCCFLKGLETIEAERQWPRRSAKLLLKTALAALGRHYFPVARGASHSKRVLTWGSDDYRPQLMP